MAWLLGVPPRRLAALADAGRPDVRAWVRAAGRPRLPGGGSVRDDDAIAAVLVLLLAADPLVVASAQRRDPAEVAAGVSAVLAGWDADPAAARRLLLEVDPPGDYRPTASRRSARVVAAGTTLALVVGAAAVVLARHRESPTTRAVAVPAVFGLDAGLATAVATDLGLDPRVETVPSCAPVGTVLAADPAQGTSLEPGDPVALRVAGAGPRCLDPSVQRDAWRFLAFALGHGVPPRLDDRVYLVADGGYPVLLDHDVAAAGDWGPASATAALERAAAGPAPALVVRTLAHPTARTCGSPMPPGGKRRVVRVSLDPDTTSPGCPVTVDLYPSPDGIDAVVLYSSGS